MVCAIKGYAFNPLSSDAFSREKIETMRAFGADVELVPSDGGTVTPALFDRFRARIAELQAQPGTFYTDQFNNDDALAGLSQHRHRTPRAAGHDRCVLRRRRDGRHAGGRLARAEGGRQPRADCRARAAGIAGVDAGPRRPASRGRHRHRSRAAASEEERLRRSARDRRRRGARCWRSGWRRRKASSPARRAP